MSADKITPALISQLALALDLAARSVGSIYRDSMTGDTNPQAASAEINRIIATLNAAAK